MGNEAAQVVQCRVTRYARSIVYCHNHIIIFRKFLSFPLLMINVWHFSKLQNWAHRWPVKNLCRFERINFTHGLLTRHRGKMSCWAVSVFNQDWLICSMLLLLLLLVCLQRIQNPWMCLLLRPICVELRSPYGNKDRECIRRRGFAHVITWLHYTLS